MIRTTGRYPRQPGKESVEALSEAATFHDLSGDTVGASAAQIVLMQIARGSSRGGEGDRSAMPGRNSICSSRVFLWCGFSHVFSDDLVG